MIDLNKLKQVNGTHGHEAADELLREVDRRLKILGRDADSFYRLGDDAMYEAKRAQFGYTLGPSKNTLK